MTTIPIIPVFEHYGGRVTRWKAYGWSGAFCVVHEDRNASAQIHEEKGRFRCLVCAFNTDAIGLVQMVEGKGFREAKRRAEEIAGGSAAVSPGADSGGPGVPGRPGHRRERRAFVPPWARRGPGAGA